MLGFSKSPARSFVNIHENEFFDYSQTNLFKDINDVINSFDKSIDYFEMLPRDLRMFFLLMQVAQEDKFLDVEKDWGYYQMVHEKVDELYQYMLVTSDSYYHMVIAKTHFTEIPSTLYPIYQLKTKDRMEAFLSLKYIYENTYLPKEKITDNKGKYR